jgi:hypothetical protein
MSKPITVNDLPEVALDRKGHQVFLYCPECGAEYSATAGDYFWMPKGEAFYCTNDDLHQLGLSEPLQLMRRVTRLVQVRRSEI